MREEAETKWTRMATKIWGLKASQVVLRVTPTLKLDGMEVFCQRRTSSSIESGGKMWYFQLWGPDCQKILGKPLQFPWRLHNGTCCFLCHCAAYFGALSCKSGPVNKWIKQWENTIHHWESMLMYQHCVHKRRLWIQIKSVWNFLSEILQQLKSNLSQPHDQIKSSLHNAYTKSNQNLGSSDFGAWNFVRKFDWYITKDWNKWMPWWVHLLLLPNTEINWYVCV